MDEKLIPSLLKKLPGWAFNPEKKCIEKEFTFNSYLKNISFVNAVAWLANQSNHHPDMEISYNRCLIRLSTHDEGGVGQKDFDLAQKINQL